MTSDKPYQREGARGEARDDEGGLEEGSRGRTSKLSRWRTTEDEYALDPHHTAIDTITTAPHAMQLADQDSRTVPSHITSLENTITRPNPVLPDPYRRHGSAASRGGGSDMMIDSRVLQQQQQQQDTTPTLATHSNLVSPTDLEMSRTGAGTSAQPFTGTPLPLQAPFVPSHPGQPLHPSPEHPAPPPRHPTQSEASGPEWGKQQQQQQRQEATTPLLQQELPTALGAPAEINAPLPEARPWSAPASESECRVTACQPSSPSWRS